MNRLIDHFERVAVVSLRSRADRRHRLRKHLDALGLAGGILWIDAVPGASTPSPEGWSAGPPAWGCLQSHLNVMCQARSDKVESVLILEDDVVFSPHTPRCLPLLAAALPADWNQFYIGGQCLTPPLPTASPLLRRATNVNRSHACAYRGAVLPEVIDHLSRWQDYIVPATATGWHMDHQLGRAHERRLWTCYLSSWWLAGQDSATSDICGQSLRRRWWHDPNYALFLPMLHLPGPRIDGEESLCFTEDEEDSFVDVHSSDGRLLVRLLSLARSALTHGCLPAWRCPLLSSERVAVLWPAGVADRSTPELNDYPFNGLFKHALPAALYAA